MAGRASIIFFWAALLFADTAGQLLLKAGAVRASHSGWTPNLYIALGFGAYAFSFIVWMQILKSVRLFIALAASSLAYIAVAFGSYFLTGEALTAQVLLGTFFIAAGVFILGVGKGV